MIENRFTVLMNIERLFCKILLYSDMIFSGY